VPEVLIQTVIALGGGKATLDRGRVVDFIAVDPDGWRVEAYPVAAIGHRLSISLYRSGWDW
jgi:hypothetical protein